MCYECNIGCYLAVCCFIFLFVRFCVFFLGGVKWFLSLFVDLCLFLWGILIFFMFILKIYAKKFGGKK